ncbi:hypothetical protein ACE01U_10955 [Acinetobacter sp. BSP-153]|uniref:hypothetical protein n=1 Tax=Acinetobacter sp. BSP-153 TaxID=3344663 RepID=UPI00376F91E3
MYITKVLSYNGAWEKLLTDHEAELNELKKFIKNYDFEYLRNIKFDTDILQKIMFTGNDFEKKMEKEGWIESIEIKDVRESRNSLGLIKNRVCVKFESSSDTLTNYIFRRLRFAEEKLKNNIDIGILLNLNKNVLNLKRNNITDIMGDWESTIKEFEEMLPIQSTLPFLIFGLSLEADNIELIEKENSNEPIMIERSIEFKPEHYQAGLGILSYFGTVMRKKYPEQNAKVKIEQEDDRVRLIVECENGNKEVIERAFDEFGLVIHQDIKPEEFYDNYLDVAELKTKLGTFESELKFQHQLVEMKEHRIIELQKDKEFLKNVIGQALVRPNSPIYINNQLQNSQTTVINHKAEFTKSNDVLEDLIDLADSEALKNRLATIQNALEVNRNSEQPEEVKDSSGMKKLAKFLRDANEVGTEANTLADKGGKALDLIKSLGRSYNSLAQWCAMPIIPSVFVKE